MVSTESGIYLEGMYQSSMTGCPIYVGQIHEAKCYMAVILYLRAINIFMYIVVLKIILSV